MVCVRALCLERYAGQDSEHKIRVLIFSTTIVWNNSHYEKKWARYDLKNVYLSSWKVPLFLSYFNDIWIFSDRFSKNPHISNFKKILLIVAFRNFAKRDGKPPNFQGVTIRFLSGRIRSLKLRPMTGWCFPSITQADAEAFGLRWCLRPIPATSLQITCRLQVPYPCLGDVTHKWAQRRTVHDGNPANHNVSQSKYCVAKNC